MRPDKFFLRDIYSASRAAQAFTADLAFEEFRLSDLHQSAVSFKLMIIGEASRQLTRGYKSLHKEIDWRSLADFRNIITHEYFSLDLNSLWLTARENMPVVEAQIRTLLEEFPETLLSQPK